MFTQATQERDHNNGFGPFQLKIGGLGSKYTDDIIFPVLHWRESLSVPLN